MDKISYVFQKEKTGVEKILDFDLQKCFDITEEQSKAFWKIFERELIVNSEFNHDAYQAIIGFCDKTYGVGGYDVVLITARSPIYKEETEEWLNRHEIHRTVKTTVYTAGHSKAPVLESFQVTLLVDDSPNIFKEISSIKKLNPNSSIGQNLSTMVVDYPYNQDIDVDLRIKKQIKGEN